MTKNHPQPLRIRLFRAGITVAELARQIKRPRQTVSRAINGSAEFPLVVREIRQFLAKKAA